MFSWEICKIFKNTYFVEHLQTAVSDGSESDDTENDDESHNESIEAVLCRCSSRYGFLKISQILQENTCIGVPL